MTSTSFRVGRKLLAGTELKIGAADDNFEECGYKQFGLDCLNVITAAVAS